MPQTLRKPKDDDNKNNEVVLILLELAGCMIHIKHIIPTPD
jgi:hypothetical protein